MKTKGFLICSTTKSALASVYKRSFVGDIINCKRPVFVSLIGYARVSTEDQPPCHSRRPFSLRDAPKSSKNTALAAIARPVLARVLERVQSGETLVVLRIDRRARSLSQLLEVIER